MADSRKDKNNVKQFEEDMVKLFNIAYSNTLQLIQIEEDKSFLISQKKLDRPS